jgi:preprotein translocase subunit SecF
VNQVLVRSINTTVIGVLPVVALLFAGAVILGEGPLKDLALALFVGMVSGAYSSVFIATPLLAQLREREPDMKKLASRVASRRSKDSRQARPAEPAADAAELDPVPEPASEPTDEELAEVTLTSRPGVKISRVSSAERPDIRPLSEGAAKRPQPQHKSRSQRKK